MHKANSSESHGQQEKEKSSTRVQPEATANTKRLFFLDVGQMPAASRVSIQFHMVSYCSAIKCYPINKS